MFANRSKAKLNRVMMVLLTLLAIGAATPAWAIDCSKATDPIDVRICGNASLKAADAAMGQAYSALLKTAPDADVRAMLISSQRRWIAARNATLGNDSQGKPLPVSELRKAITDRTSRLNDRSDKGFVAEAAAQRRFLAKYSGGTFSGFDAGCEFIPNDKSMTSFSYQCYGAMHVQNKDRLCSAQTEWATWSLYEYYGVSTVQGASAKLSAVCSDQSGDICAAGNDKGEDSSWKLNPEKDEHFSSANPNLPKLDVEGLWPLEDADATWFDQCLTSPAYPPAQ
ncbi:lysozyme inhibitor LprI family protein [Rhizobium rhizogenes]|uniref:lysozyme inhibitor LprI family protein n=1 Tax=Rhizobium rhizogenes TaxID=359 RepID=UPI00226EAC92|nr:lysozyme inhibitor LprI family protein [Rhizobium rhizogenes]